LGLDQFTLLGDHRLAGGVPLQRLDAGHLVHAHGVRPLPPLLLWCREIRVTDEWHFLCANPLSCIGLRCLNHLIYIFCFSTADRVLAPAAPSGACAVWDGV